jgi:fibronectin type 3 domain-containing protein
LLLIAAMMPFVLATPADAIETDSVVVTGDNGVEVFVNGASVGTSDDWKQATTALKNLSDGDVVAVHATDAGGVAGFVAQIEWNGHTAVTDASWKVSTTEVTDWETKAFDDGGWDNATEYGAYGISPWFKNVTDFPTESSAEWIWSNDAYGDNDVYLRYTLAPPPNGSVTVTGDNGVEVFVNGASLGSSADWKQATTVLADLADGDVVAVHATDAGGIAGFLAQIEWDGKTAVSDTTWKVSTSAVADWETKGFDDDGWDSATSYGTYGISPWLKNVNDFPMNTTAGWIWSADADGDDDIYLRYTIGTEIPPPPSGTVVVTADNGVEVFVNGSSFGSSSDWKQISTVRADLELGDVIAVHATDAGGIAGFLAQIEWDGDTVVSDASWKVSTSAVAGWQTKGFDDAGWGNATAYGAYGIAPWSTNVAGFPTETDAEWIWSADADGDNDIYLRYTLAPPPPDLDPVAPQNLVATAGDGVVDLTWDANTTDGDLLSYNVYRSVTSPVSLTTSFASVPAGTETYSDSTAVNGTTYYYVVTSLDDDPAESPASNEEEATPTPPPSGTVVVTGDNGVELFINGASYGTSNDWRQASTVLLDLAPGDVVAVHATDAGGAGGFLAQIEWDGDTVVSDTSWKVSTTAVADWETKGFNDAGWDDATSYGAYGIAPWSTNVAGFPGGSAAEWIWSADADGDNDVYLRYTLQLPPPDLDPVAPRNLVANAGDNVVNLRWSHNTTDADLLSYNVYRSETSPVSLTTPIGSVPAGTRTYSDNTAVNGTTYHYVVTSVDDDPAESPPSNEREATPVAPPNGTVVVTGDNGVEVFVNGVSYGTSDDWRQASTVIVDLADGDVIAVHATDIGGAGGLLAQIEWDGNTVISDTSWKVTSVLETDWETKTFDDSGWDAATSYGAYGVDPWGMNVTDFPTASVAEWIWTSNSIGHNSVYLRYTIGG